MPDKHQEIAATTAKSQNSSPKRSKKQTATKKSHLRRLSLQGEDTW